VRNFDQGSELKIGGCSTCSADVDSNMHCHR
jgi:hypothetical protein